METWKIPTRKGEQRKGKKMEQTARWKETLDRRMARRSWKPRVLREFQEIVHYEI